MTNLVEDIKNNKVTINFKGHNMFPNKDMLSKDLKKATVYYYWDDSFVSHYLDNYITCLTIALSKLIENNVADIGFTGVEDNLFNLHKLYPNIFTKEKKEYEVSSVFRRCGECGKEIKLMWDGKKVYAKSECEVLNGIKPWTIEINVPSGKLVFANDLRDLFPNIKDYDINHKYGQKLSEEAYAKLGLFNIYVGNTCPDIYSLDNKLIIGNVINYDTDKPYPGYENVIREGGVCTDVWDVSACDYDDYMNRIKSEDNYLNNISVVTLKDGPGIYELTSYYSCASDRDNLIEYAVIKKKDKQMKTDDKAMYVLRIREKYVKVTGYSNYYLVDHPHRGTTFSREKDAINRLEKIKQFSKRDFAIEVAEVFFSYNV